MVFFGGGGRGALCLFIIELERNIYILVSAFGRTTKTRKNEKEIKRSCTEL
jgi:hypothetical protein